MITPPKSKKRIKLFNLSRIALLGLTVISSAVITVSCKSKKGTIPYIDNLDQYFNYEINTENHCIDIIGFKYQSFYDEITEFKFHSKYNVDVNGQYEELPISKFIEKVFSYSHLHIVDLSETSISTIPKQCFFNSIYLTSVILPATCRSIELNAFTYTSITEINLLNVSVIAADAFIDAICLKKIEISNSITSVGKEAFDNCTSLESVVWNSRASVSDHCFSNCTNLRIFNGSQANFTSVGDMAFMEDQRLDTCILPNSVTTIGGSAFVITGLKAFTFPSSYRLDFTEKIINPFAESYINSWNINGVTNLESRNGSLYIKSDGTNLDTLFCVDMQTQNYQIPNFVHYICEMALTSRNLLNLTAENNVELIVNDNFPDDWASETEGVNGLCSLRSVNLSNTTCPIIPFACFAGDVFLTSVNLSDDLISIGRMAFNDTGINSLDFLKKYNRAVIVGVKAFAGAHLTNIIPSDIKCILKDSTSMPTNLFGYNPYLASLTWDVNAFNGIDNTIPELDATFINCENLISVDLSGLDHCTTLTNAFANCGALSQVVLPHSITIIDNAFSGCYSLPSIKFTNVEIIRNTAFRGCSSMQSIEFKEQGTAYDNLSIIDSDELGKNFADCTKLSDIYFDYATSTPPSGINYENFRVSTAKITIHLPESLNDISAWTIAFPSNYFNIQKDIQ